MTDYNSFRNQLASIYAPSEAAAIARLVFEKVCSLSLADIYAGKDTELSADMEEVLEKTLSRLLQHEPVQYVLGVADFCGREFLVNPSVLIPRPETEELCGLIKLADGMRILDACTGSGCIAITLALSAKNIEVEAYDISADAVATARRNADCLGADVHFFVADALAPLPNADKRYDIIVSNPPYICESERRAMEKNVLDYEPGAALFVPDSNPLLFYQAITDYAAAHLYNNGRLYFEVNPDYADEVATYVISNGFTQAKVIEDSFGKKRFVEALL